MGGSNGVGNSNRLTDVQYAPINSDGSIGTWRSSVQLLTNMAASGYASYNGFVYLTGGFNASSQLTNVFHAASFMANGSVHGPAIIPNGGSGTFTTARHSTMTVAYRGYLYVIGGEGASSAPLADIQYVGLDVASRTAQYSKLIDLGADSDLKSISYTGSLPDGPADLMYALAPTSGGLGNFKSSGNVTPVVSGQFCAAAGLSHYAYVTAKLQNDFMYAAFPAESGPRSNLQDITLNYEVSLIAPTNARLFNGKWFYQESLQPYAACPS